MGCLTYSRNCCHALGPNQLSHLVRWVVLWFRNRGKGFLGGALTNVIGQVWVCSCTNITTNIHCILPGMISESFVIRKYKLEPLTLYLSCECLSMCFYTSWWFFANMVSPAKMTITASTASKFCARSRSECSYIFFLDLESWWIPGNIEPWTSWSECQPEGSRLRSANSWN